MDGTIVNYILSPIVLGFFLDCLLGDPEWFPHPVRLFGKLISAGDNMLNKGNNKIFKGGILVLILILLVFLILYLIQYLIKDAKYVRLVYESAMVYLGIACRRLITESLRVDSKLREEGIEAARQLLSRIVGRDTSNLSAQQVRIATLETLSENLSDGVIAPLFFYAIGGIPLMFAYKLVNTMDSMIGYKNEKYIQFGRVAARLDDIANYLPARITASLMVLITMSWQGMKYILIFGNKHSSPNSGYPEAALAGILNCRFGGNNYYHGQLVAKPYIGNNDREVATSDIRKASLINVAVTVISITLILVISGLQ